MAGRLTLADDAGPFGNPTSDSARTMVTTATTRALVVIFVPGSPSVGARALTRGASVAELPHRAGRAIRVPDRIVRVSVGVIIVAAGRGARLGGESPKQLLDLGGRSILQRSVAAFDAHPQVSISSSWCCRPDLVADGAAHRRPTDAAVCRRGRRRAAAGFGARMASRRCRTTSIVVLVHDAARPFVSAALIDRVIAARGARRRGAGRAGRATRSSGSIGAARVVTATIPRDESGSRRRRRDFGARCCDDAVAHGAAGADATDEAMLAEQAGHPVASWMADERT